MNGPQHYREGERLLALSEHTPSNYDETNPAATLLAAQATAHFLAAQVAEVRHRRLRPYRGPLAQEVGRGLRRLR
ncbi:hypothetical protein ACWEPZ_37650, partial [Streptomyces sp. NPDC004288]